MITGGAGFNGSHVVRRLVSNYPHYRIFNIDKLTYAGNIDNLRVVEAVEPDHVRATRSVREHLAQRARFELRVGGRELDPVGLPRGEAGGRGEEREKSEERGDGQDGCLRARVHGEPPEDPIGTSPSLPAGRDTE